MFITLFCSFFSHRCTTAMWNFPILRTCVVEYVNMTQKFPLFFLNTDTVLSISNWIRSMKVETVQPHFLSNVFSLWSSRSFATMTRWCNDFFSLSMTMDNCKGFFFGMQMHLEIKPLTVLWETPQLCILCLHMGKTVIFLQHLVLIICLIIDVLFLIVAVSSSCFPSTCSELCSTHWSPGQTRGEFYCCNLFKLAKCPLSQSWQSRCNNVILYDDSYWSNFLYLVLISMCDLLLECATL